MNTLIDLFWGPGTPLIAFGVVGAAVTVYRDYFKGA